MMKNVQQIRTMFPIGRSDDNRVWTTSFKPGARLMTLQQQQQQHIGIITFASAIIHLFDKIKSISSTSSFVDKLKKSFIVPVSRPMSDI